MEIKSLDLYCERLSAEFWAEPVNALTNLAFVIVGVWALWKCRRFAARPLVVFLSAMIAIVGVGSFLFHTYANTLTVLGDLIPIFIFTGTYLYYSLRHLLDWSTKWSLLGLVACVSSMVLIQLFVPNRILNGSVLYAPPLLMLFFVATKMRSRRPTQWSRIYLAGAFTLFLSLIMRTLDSAICEVFPLGTHFLWHLLNGACLWFLIRVALREDQARRSA